MGPFSVEQLEIDHKSFQLPWMVELPVSNDQIYRDMMGAAPFMDSVKQQTSQSHLHPFSILASDISCFRIAFLIRNVRLWGCQLTHSFTESSYLSTTVLFLPLLLSTHDWIAENLVTARWHKWTGWEINAMCKGFPTG